MCIFKAIFCINAVEVVRDLFAAVRMFFLVFIFLNIEVLFHQLHQPIVKMEMNRNMKESTVQKNMAAVRFTDTIPCKPDTANRHTESHIFGEIRPCTNNFVRMMY